MDDTEKWIPGMGIEREIGYSYFPALHLWTVELSKVTSMNIVDIARFVYPLLCGPLTVVLYYIILRPMLGKKVATWASLVFCLNFMFVFFDGEYVHESMGLIFYLLYLGAVFTFYFQRWRSREFILIGILASFATVFCHHWSAYNILLISTVFLFLPNLYSYILGLLHRKSFKRVDKPSLVFASLTYVTVLSWITFISRDVLVEHLGWGIGFLISILHPFTSEYPLPAMAYYAPLEKLFIVLGILVLITLGGSELVHRFFKKKDVSDLIMESWFIFSSLYIFVFSYLSPGMFGPEQLSINYRCWTFAFFGLSPLIAKNVSRHSHNMHKKSFAKLKPLALVFPLISAVLLFPISVRNPTFFPSADSCYNTALWAKQYLSNETIAIDEFSGYVIIPYGRIESYRYVRALPLTSVVNQTTLILYQSENSFYYATEEARVIFFNNHITEGNILYPNVSANSSRLDNLCNRIYDSSTLTVYIKTVGNR
jgi:hypothetical protein